ncbi:hypothetical protein TSAR_006518 [Trichomalopsis sarcophagae]|uniref:BEN domain-containing protein n=1 Tax=Trichomalopsis sarcophagae TaxID=543379 RepID=A0A232EH49_9HYME|nr:hypothetical protein TSAR_006518 [Trichomalopsis sarcophagae]
MFIAVEKFVNTNVANKKYTVGHQEYRTVLTTYCATLRNPKPKASHMKIERKINFRNELKDDVKISLQESTDDQKNKHFESTQNENVEDEENNNPVVALESSQDSMDATMELIRGSRIIVNAFKVDNIRNMHKRNPRKMIRKLMKLILGEETLKHSSPTGKNSWTPIPENVFIAVEKFVNTNVANKKYTVGHQEYRTVLTTYCATLRNPKPKASHMKIERKINFRNELKDDVKISLQESTDDQKNKHFESTQNENVEDEENNMELIRGSRIIVNAFKVDNIRNMHKRNPRKMIRKLMKLILGEETLKHSSPTGKNSWTPIPENVFIAVEKFVNANVAKKKYTVSHQEYRTVLTTYCATLRNPKPKASHMKIERKINFRNELKDDVKISLQESTDDQKNKHFESTQNENVEDEENDVEDKEENKLLEEEKDKRRKQHVSQEARRRKETKIQEPVALQEEPQRKSRETTKRSHDENGKVAGKLTAGSSTFKPKNQDTSYY